MTAKKLNDLEKMLDELAEQAKNHCGKYKGQYIVVDYPIYERGYAELYYEGFKDALEQMKKQLQKDFLITHIKKLESKIEKLESAINKNSTLADYCPDGTRVVEVEYLEDAFLDT